MSNYPDGTEFDSRAPYNEKFRGYCEKCERGTNSGLNKATLKTGTIFICDDCAEGLHICEHCGIFFDDDNGEVLENLCDNCIK